MRTMNNARRIIPSAYQVILMILALSGAATTWKEQEGLTRSKLLKVLVLDQVLYFLMYVHTLTSSLYGRLANNTRT